MKTKRITACVIFLSMALALNSCGDTDTDPKDTDADISSTSETVNSNPYGDKLPEKMNLDGYNFRVLIFENGNTDKNTSWRAWVDTDEQNGETMNDAAYLRNAEVEDRLNVKISCIEIGKFGETVPIVYNSVMAGEDAYDMAILQNDRTKISTLLSENCLIDLNSIDAIDLSQPYYLQSAREVFDINGKLYLLSGDAFCSLYSQSYVFTNMDMWNDYKLEDPYEIVRSGKWTLDKCMSLIKGTWKDLNGNGTADEDDSFGITGLPATLTYCFQSGGGRLYESNKNGYSFPVASERNLAIVERLIKEMDNPDCYFNYKSSATYSTAFYGGRSLMFFSGSSITKLRDAEFYAGLLPFPKFDENQENYYSILTGAIAGIPITVTDPERTGTIVEAYFSASSRYLKPAFIQTYVEQKVLRDEGSQEMFNLILECGRHDFLDFVDPAGQFNGLSIIEGLVSERSNSLASKWASMKDSVEKNYADFFKNME